MIRVVGPSLEDFGVKESLPDPTMVLVNTKSGHTPGVGFPAIVYSDGSTPESHYYDWVGKVPAAVGAFPIPLYQPHLRKRC